VEAATVVDAAVDDASPGAALAISTVTASRFSVTSTVPFWSVLATRVE
jgi:hypothetical protein